jgi:AcrR family transcriptional regulator
VADLLDRRGRRHEAARAEIIEAAWRLAREHGLAQLSLRELAAAVGMRAPSLYHYFPNKHAIYDAMFRQGCEAHLERMADLLDDRGQPVGNPAAALRAGAHRFMAFCIEDPVRYRLLFQRILPDFEPSAGSYALAQQTLVGLHRTLAALGVDDPAAVDLFTALLTGLTDQQLSNDPGGDRWVRLVDDAVDMYLAYLAHVRPRARS